MNGWLIVNGFLASAKFDDLYALLTAAFAAHGVHLMRFPNTAFTTPLGDYPRPCTCPDAVQPDFVVFWDKDIALARRLEAVGLPVFNSADAVATCDDKAKTALALAKAGLRTPRTILGPKTFEGIGYTTAAFLNEAARTLGFPFVMKESYGSFGQQVHLVHTLAEAESVLQTFGHKEFILQEFIASSRGRDLRLNVVGDRVVATLLRTSATDFRSNVTLGGTAVAHAPTAAQAQAALDAAKAVGATFAGVDILFGPDDDPIVCEVNSNPHFRSTLDATGVNLAEAIAEQVMQSL
ncbi:MAG: RimK family alpha-L-glutamate ligase [Kiritimatiellae bacterium]|nr:RimK family alpha-L-glutamate ligase [Kiritimatiellia bacterium]